MIPLVPAQIVVFKQVGGSSLRYLPRKLGMSDTGHCYRLLNVQTAANSCET